MGWRKVRFEDLRLGLALRLTTINDTPFNGHTVIAIDGDMVRLARPMAYSHPYNARQPMVYTEVYETTVTGLCRDNTDAEVWELRNGTPLTYQSL